MTLDDIEERAAIIAEGCNVSREKSEALTAKMYDAMTWDELINRVGGDKDGMEDD